jgi:putative heme-binding domain-containing protein
MVKWFEEAGRPYSDGASFANFLKNFLRDVVPNLSEAELKELSPIITAINDKAVPNYNTKPRQTVKQYKIEDLLEKVSKVETGRNFERGRDAYIAGQCIKCHRMGDEGGAVGPDLTAISSRFNRKDILESIIEPSKVLSDQYQNETFTTLSGKTIIGRVVDQTPKKIVVQTDPLSANRVEIPMDDLEKRAPSQVSPMPANLIDVLTEEEILDLFAYMESGGNKNHRLFRK